MIESSFILCKECVMKVVINGIAQDFDAAVSLLEAMKILNIQEKVVALALNSNIVKKEQWNSVILKENDKLEVLQFVSGG